MECDFALALEHHALKAIRFQAASPEPVCPLWPIVPVIADFPNKVNECI